jgi:uncharacterized protein (TIGR02246 family)
MRESTCLAQPQEEIMMLRLISLATFAVVLTVPAVAQQKVAATQQRTQQQIKAVTAKWEEAFNSGDGKTVAALYSADNIAVNRLGMRTGTQDYEKRVQDEAKLGAKITLSVDQVRAMGNDAALAAGAYQIGYTANPAGSQFEGNWLRVFERQGSDWKIIASTFTPVGTPAAATAAQPSTGTSTPPATGKTPK